MSRNQPKTVELLPITPIISPDAAVIFYCGKYLEYLNEIHSCHEKYGLDVVNELNQKILEKISLKTEQEAKPINEKLPTINEDNEQETKPIKQNSRSCLNTFIKFFQLNKSIESKNAKEQTVKRQSVFYI